MASTSALQLVNRVNLMRRQPEVTAFDSPEMSATLHCVNMALGDVLDTRRWEFDLRHDGQLTTMAVLDGISILTVATTKGALATRSAGLLDSQVSEGDFVLRVWRDGSSEYANTALRVDHAQEVSGGVSSVLVMDGTLPDSSTDDCEFHYSEYILPDTVKEVVRVSYQERELSMRQVDPRLRYDEIYPNQNSVKGEPEIISVGGYDVRTYQSGATDPPDSVIPDPGLRFAIWPVPDDQYVLNYSYYYQHPELTETTSVLDGVPPSVVNDIVLQAASYMQMSWDQNYAAAHFTDLSREQSAVKHRMYSGSKSRRSVVHSFENQTGTGLRVQRGFPGRTLG